MATVAVTRSIDVDKLVNSVDISNNFLIDPRKVSVNVSATSSAATAKEDRARRFALNDESFLQLQAYLKAAQKLPNSTETFEQTYDPKLFKPWFEKISTRLYADTRTLLVNIHEHCNSFETSVISKSINLAGMIKNYAEDATKHSASIQQGMEILLEKDLKMDTTRAKDAKNKVWEACKQLSRKANNTGKECVDVSQAYIAFKVTTEGDRSKLQQVNTDTDRALPKDAQIGEDLQIKLKGCVADLKKMFWEQNEAMKVSGWNTGRLSFTSSSGLVMYCNDEYTLKKLKALDDRFADTWKQINGDSKNAMLFSDMAKSLESLIDGVWGTIDKAIEALQAMSSSFSRVNTDLRALAEALESVEDYIDAETIEKRGMVSNRLAEAKAKWTLVYEAAEYFQDKGILLSREFLDKGAERPPVRQNLEVLGANFGSLDITSRAKSLYYFLTFIEIEQTARTFGDPWPTIEKTISCCYRYKESYRIFVAFEYGKNREELTYRLVEGDIGLSKTSGALHQQIWRPQAPSGSRIQILSIVWGNDEVRKEGVARYLYGRVNDTIYWSNNTMGGDTMPGRPKSGVVYYTVGNDPTVRSVSNKEGMSSFFAAS